MPELPKIPVGKFLAIKSQVQNDDADQSPEDLQEFKNLYQKWTQLSKKLKYVDFGKEDLTVLKSLDKPPKLIIDVMAALCLMSGLIDPNRRTTYLYSGFLATRKRRIN